MKPRPVPSLIMVVCLLPWLSSPAAAQFIQAVGGAPGKAPAEEKVPISNLVIQPAGEPREALKYRLLPPLLDRRPGSAAIHYEKIALLVSEAGRAKKFEKVADWLELPLDKMPRDEVRQTLASLKYLLDELDAAARRDRCDWELPFREGDFMSMLLPDLQHMRNLGRLVALQARLQIADRKFDEAIHSLQTGFALARHVGQGGTLIHGLVGISIGNSISARVQELIQQPGAPNLYSALTELPQPLVDLRPALEAESDSLYHYFPALREIDRSKHDPAFWQNMLDGFDKIYQEIGATPPAAGLRGTATALALRGYPIAKRALIEQGRTAEEVEAMPVPEVVVRYSVQTYNELRDRMFKWLFVPYPQGRAGMQEAERYLKTEGVKREIVPLASMALPAMGSVSFTMAKSDRSIAVLRVIEALRIHAAGHEGRLPEKLADIAAVPVPVDPTTGQAFSYQKTGIWFRSGPPFKQPGDTAVLESNPPGRPSRDGLRLEITIK